MPGRGKEEVKANGFVFAASMISKTSSPIRSEMIFISLTSPILTERWMFSSSLTISAARVELTGTTWSLKRPNRARPALRQAGGGPSTILGMLDRKSVGEGTSGSGGDEHGGRRF